jgi:hypothetical protein
MSVNFAFFEALTDEEAFTYLDGFLREGRESHGEFVAAAEQDGVVADLSLESIEPVMAWVAGTVVTVPRDEDPALPWWIRESDSYKENLFDFDESSRALVLCFAFYLGETFTRAYPRLTWGVGRRNVAEQGQPVVTGFAHSIEMAVLLVGENLVTRAVTGGPSSAGAERAVSLWASWAPRA